MSPDRPGDIPYQRGYLLFYIALVKAFRKKWTIRDSYFFRFAFNGVISILMTGVEM